MKFDPGPEKGEPYMVIKIGDYEAVARVAKCPKCNGPLYTCSHGCTRPCTNCFPIFRMKELEVKKLGKPRQIKKRKKEIKQPEINGTS